MHFGMADVMQKHLHSEVQVASATGSHRGMQNAVMHATYGTHARHGNSRCLTKEVFECLVQCSTVLDIPKTDILTE